MEELVKNHGLQSLLAATVLAGMLQLIAAALVAVMIVVSIGTFSWGSLRDLRTHPKSSSVVMLGTVMVTVWTHDLAKGVFAGVLLSAFFFARKVGRMLQVQEIDRKDGVRVYAVRGQVFFASAGQFAASFDLLSTPSKLLIDLSHAHFWDISAVAALDWVVLTLRAHGAVIDVVGLNQASDTLIERLGTHRRVGARVRVGH